MRIAYFVFLLLVLALSACSGSNSTPTSPGPAPQMTLPGGWTLQTVASDRCSGLSADAKSRSCPIVTIYQAGYSTITITVSISNISTPIMNNTDYSGLKIQDRLRLVDNSIAGGLAIDGTFTSSLVSQNKIAGTLNGNFTTATADCAATDHTVTFTR
jgi:hypothetical protein